MDLVLALHHGAVKEIVGLVVTISVIAVFLIAYFRPDQNRE